MTTLSRNLSNTSTMFRRVVKHMRRNFAGTIVPALFSPILMLLMMLNIFGRTVEDSGNLGGGATYINYLTPGLILFTAAYGISGAALRANTDMTQGIINRFRTMSIARISVLTGHVFGNVIITLFTIGVILVLAALTGFRPVMRADTLLAAAGLTVFMVFALSWLAVAMGVNSKSPEGAMAYLYVILTMPFLSTAFVPPASMTPILAWFAENQPFSPIIDTIRGLLMGGDVGTRGLVALGWCTALTLVGYVWARIGYNRTTSG
jgi:ABC-2 type transport system permease protein